MSLQKILNTGAVFFSKDNQRDRSYLGKVHLYSIPAIVFGEFQVVFRRNTFKFSLGVNIKGLMCPPTCLCGSPQVLRSPKICIRGVNCKLSAIYPKHCG